MRRLLVWLLGVALIAGVLGAAGSASAEPVPPAAGLKERIWPDETIYFIFLDRFANGDRSSDAGVSAGDPRGWHGGDLQGVIDKLDYIKSLGFTAIWITPHVKNAGRDYHGYGAVDFFETDPHFGTVAKTRELVERAHAKGLKVIFDIVVNHTGPQHPLAVERPDWFHPRQEITNWNDERQVQDGWIFSLPDFDQSKPEVREYILRYSRFWIEQTGVDGFRLDTVKHVPAEFFTWYGAELQKVKPGFWLIGEVWMNGPYKLAAYQKAGVTALLDFPVSQAAREVFARDQSMSSLAAVVRNVERTMPDPWQMGAFLDNHDMPRFATAARNDPVARLKLGLTFLFTQRSIPILYYGTEIAMPGGEDPYNRADFPWGEEPNPEVQQLVRRLNQIRRNHPALRRGTVEELLADQRRYVYLRAAGQDQVVVVLNNSPEPFAAEVELTGTGLADGAVLQDELTGAKVTVAGGLIRPELDARSGAIYTPVPQLKGFPLLWGALAALTGGVLLIGRRRRRR